MNTRFTLFIAAAAAVGLVAPHPAAAQSSIKLTNGVFKDSTGNYNGGATADFSGTGGYGFSFGSHYNAVTNSGGSLYINGGSVYQFLGTTGAAGEVLTLNGFDFNNGTAARSGVEFTSAAPTTNNQLATGSILASEALIPPPTATPAAFAPLTFTTTTANQGIYLVIVGPDPTVSGNYGAHIDYQNFTLTDVPAAVPEASSSISLGLLIVLGLGGFVVARKRNASALPA